MGAAVLEEEAEIGILALEKGLISQESLNDCLSSLSDDGGHSLVDLLRSKNLLKPDQIEGLRKEALKRIRSRGGDVPELPADEDPTAPTPPASEPAPSGQTTEAASAALPAEVARATRDVANVIGKFVRVQDMGRGSRSNVMKAWDVERQKYVALKLIKEGGGSEHIARFMKEAESTVGLEHPGIAMVYETGRVELSDGPRAYVASEFIEGETLDQVRARGLQVQRAAQIMRDAALAVSYAHSRGVLHKDLKPKNIMLGFDGRVRVTDFGLAQVSATLGPTDDSLLSRTIQVAGTPSYMSPEQALGRTGDIRERSDVYSLGATLYYLITGRPPFDASGNAMKTCFAVVREPLVPPSQFNANVKADLEQIVSRAMAKDPVRRYDTAKHVADDLDRFIQGVAIVSDDQMRFTQGVAAVHAGRLEEAIHMFKELIRLEAAGRLGELGMKSVMKQLEEGENGVTLAIKQQGKNYDIRTQRGVYRFARAILTSLEGNDPSGACKNALEDFVIACELRSESTPSRVNRSNVLIFGGRYARDSGKDVSPIFAMALKDLDAALEFDPTCSPAYHNRGIVRFYMARSVKKGAGDPEPDYRKAIDDFSRAAELEPTYAYIFKDLGVVKVALAKQLLARGEKVKALFEQAVAHLDVAIQLNGSIYGAYYERGQAHFALKDFRAAIKDFKRCLELDPSRDKKVQALIDEAQKHHDTRKL
jgi:tetratricopeptide (TPR) repeat protein/tRNA A-37 threonylcarbamoyl transferase component Bud32